MKKFLSILLAVMMVLSTVSFAAPSLAGNADTAVEVSVDELYAPEEATANLAADISEDSSTYGEMIFEVNFNNLTSLDSQKINLKDAAWINPEFDYTYQYLTEKATVSFSAWPTYSIKENAGNKYLELSGGTDYAVLLIESGTERGFQGEDGIYTLTADVYTPDAMPLTTRFTGSKSEDTPIQDFSAVNNAGWGKMILQHDPSCYGNGGHAEPMTSAKEVKTIKFHRNGGTDDKTVGYDNIRLYYKPLTVDVTVKGAGQEVTVPVSTNGFAAGSLSEALDLDFYQAAGKVTIGGVEYDANDTVYLVADAEAEVEVVTLPEDEYNNEYGLAIFNIDFENHNIGDDVQASNGDFKVGSYVTPIGEKVMSHDASNWHINESGYDIKVYADPKDPTNKVAGVLGATSTGYPCLLFTTYMGSARYGWIEDNNLIWTVTGDIYDTTNDGVTVRFGGKSSICENEGLAKWTSVEDVPTEGAITEKAASTWYTFKGTMLDANYKRMGGSDELSFIKFHSASPTNADLYWDNIRLYYKPKTTTVKFAEVAGVTFENNVLENVSTAGVKVSDLLSQAGFAYDDFLYAFKGVTVGNGTEVYGSNDTVTFGGKTTLHVVLEKKDLTGWLDEKGLLLYEIDFDDLANGTQIANYAKVSTFGRVNPYIEGSEDWYINLSGFGTVANADYGVVENGALKFTKLADNRWAQIQISNEANGNMIISGGSIYKEADQKLVTTISGVTLGLTGYARKYNASTGKWEGGTNNQNSVQTLNTITPGQWHSLSGSKVIEDQEYNSESCTIYLPTYPVEGGIGDEYYLDNLRLYWKPAKANLTVYGGSNAGYETVTLKDVSTSASIEEVIALLPGSEYGKITGLADMDGNKLTDLGLVTSKSVVAIWTPWVVIEGGQEFAIDGKGLSNASGQWTASYGNQNEVGNGGGQVTGAVSWMYGNGWYSKNGNMYRVQDTVAIGENNASLGTATWSTPAVHSDEANGTIRDQINTNLPAGNDAEFVLIKYRYTNLPNLAEIVANDPNPEGKRYSLSANGEELTYYDRTGTTQVFDMSPEYGAKYFVQRQDNIYAYGGGEAFHKNELMVEGEWMYDFLPFHESMNTSGVKQVLIQRYNLFDQMVTEYDYIRFVKLGEEEEDVVLPDLGDDEDDTAKLDKPETYEETDVRLVSEDHTKNGVRFKAAISAQANEEATTIGFVVAAESKLSATGSYDNLTVDATFAKVGYKRLDGVEQTNYFDSSDDALVMAAVLKGIDEEHYTDYIVARPFVAVDGEYVYGECVVTSLYDELAKLYFVDPSDPEGSELTDYINNLWETDEELYSYIEEIIYLVNEW